MAAPPDRHRPREQRATGSRELQPAAAFVIGIHTDRNETVTLQRLECGGKRRSVGAKHGSDRTDGGRRGLIERHQKRKLPTREAERPQRVVETPRERARGALQVKTQAGVADKESCFEWNFGCL